MYKLLNLYDVIKTNNNIFVCPHCKKDLYKVNLPQERHSIISAKDFEPLNSKIPQPKMYDEMICPLCHKPMVWDFKKEVANVA